MSTTTTRIEVTNARTQSNLKEDILDHKVAPQVGISGKARGPQKAKISDAYDMSMTNMSGECVEFKGGVIS